MGFVPFQLEEWQSKFETTVKFNLADSGCHPAELGALLPSPSDQEQLLSLSMHYPPVGGTEKLKGLVADWHGAKSDNVLVTVGAAEANSIAISALIRPGDEVIVMEPGYRQVRGCAENCGAKIKPFPLDPSNQWRPDVDALRSTVTPQTKLIALTNPNNPTGIALTLEEMDAIIIEAKKCGAWILSDEVYRGTELWTDSVTPSFWGRYDKLICVGSLSKAFGLPGLRLGWLVTQPEMVDQAWRRHEYAVIATSTLSMFLAERALASPLRERLLHRNRALVREGYQRLLKWVDASDGLISIITPQATALAFICYNLKDKSITSEVVGHALRKDKSVLVGVGEHFGVEHHLRITHGLPAEQIDPAFEAIEARLRDFNEQ